MNNPIRIFCFARHALVRAALQCLIDTNHKFVFIGSANIEPDGINYLEEVSSVIDIVLIFLQEDDLNFLIELRSRASAKLVAIIDSEDVEYMDSLVKIGVHGLIMSTDGSDQFHKAINKIHSGEIWLNRVTTSRIIKSIGVAGGQQEEGISDPSLSRIDRLLTPREKEIFSAIGLGEGQSLEQIAASLFISNFTLRNHLTSIYNKLGVANRLQLYVVFQKINSKLIP